MPELSGQLGVWWLGEGGQAGLRLTGPQTFSTGAVHLTYLPADG